MKNTKWIISVLVAVVFGCTDDFDDINTNPNVITADQLDGTFAGAAFANALYKGLHHGSWTGVPDDLGTYGLITYLHSTIFVHYQSAVPTGWATDRNGINDGWRSRGWLRFYTLAVPSLNTAYQAAEGNADAKAVLDIWKVFMYHKVTDHWGPVPYSEAGIGGASVAYDSQESMYTDFFTLLDNANSTLNASSASSVAIFEGFDRVFDGDIEKWRKFGNSLRLRLALRISDVDAENARIQAEAAVAAGVMESNDDNAFYEVSEETFNNLNTMSGHNGWGFAMTASMESILKGYADPRMAIWFSPAPNTGFYSGQPNGGSTNRSWARNDVGATNDAIFGNDLRATKDIEILLAAENFFNLSEAALNGWNVGGGTAQSYYEQGIEASMNQWGVTDVAAIANYIGGTTLPVEPDLAAEYTAVGLSATPPVQVPVAWAVTEGDQRTQIAVQKYLGLYPESWEAWSDLRRTDANILYPLLNTENTDANVGRGLMKRLTYLPNEYSTNAEEVDKAIATLGGPDVGGTLVWWDVK
ncbi:SusD/RagB family nutrient-binding outer membrane lipoprotein [Fulvivirgaceae bacterium BMA10]|uniref:SusD/RagB family nutrient-binding outer membrane lipoprotein n=1 Tax=Splendidivirga corallicola TaxID=3051826 RepID=A0ABT8KK38_9BACT|nr:SusD/RagB family nutrient-binding outer membrane lipoprotein [Fulvivirgaceae bacterium BMA10]